MRWWYDLFRFEPLTDIDGLIKQTAISHAADNFHVHNDRVEDPGADADAIERQSARASADSDEPERVSGEA